MNACARDTDSTGLMIDLAQEVYREVQAVGGSELAYADARTALVLSC